MKSHYNRLVLWTLVTVSTLLIFTLQAWSKQKESQPTQSKLLVVLVIDQFRADYLTRFEKRFLPAKPSSKKVGGFNYLIGNGAYFPFAEYGILQNMTGPGHATILTGAYPYQMGIPVNEWYNHATQAPLYCVEDQSKPTVGANPKSPHVGTSPKNMISTTLGDELKNAGYASKTVAIALKDRSSILMGGHRADLALWMDRDSMQWVSSKYYLPDGILPKWVSSQNEILKKEREAYLEWPLPLTPDTGLSIQNLVAPLDKFNSVRMGNQFPHKIGKDSPASFATPFGLESTEKMALAALKQFSLGKGPSTDILAVSFSSHDYLGHTFGPNSREMEEMAVAEDQVISHFLNQIQESVPGGLKNVSIVLTGDHGIPPNPDWLLENRINAGRVLPKDLHSKLEKSMREKLGDPKEKDWIAFSESLNFYISRDAVSASKHSLAHVRTTLKDLILQEKMTAHAFTLDEYKARTLPPGMFEQQILKTYFEGRSGDVILIPKPYFFADRETVSHMTGYTYDRTVPLIFMGAPFKKGIYSQKAMINDIAPTLSFVLKIISPTLSEGRVLSEILK